MMGSLDNKLRSWQWQLESRYGDPRAYEAQRTEMMQRETRLAHDLDRRKGSQDYESKKAKSRKKHDERMAQLKSQNYRRTDRRPQSAPAPAERQTPRLSQPASADTLDSAQRQS